ncbi:hypothetical protein HRI_003751100 [Hibiscus trionum]|uniref:S-protein homolog n=1 Tax=Hibiscus trionum TaxID=183268 RepID=A0A9W7MGC1_HIBTR|nr:hypothetical protein HRI_003751100 [Hibiscus trionum]
MPYNYNTLTCPALCVLLLACLISPTPLSYAESAVDKVLFRVRFKVHIINGMPDNAMPLEIVCHSIDDDLGHHTLWKDQEFKFEFIARFWRKTHFVCNFNWGPKSVKDVTVFVTRVETKSCKESGNCFWKATPQGIYFSSDFQNWELRFGW